LIFIDILAIAALGYCGCCYIATFSPLMPLSPCRHALLIFSDIDFHFFDAAACCFLHAMLLIFCDSAFFFTRYLPLMLMFAAAVTLCRARACRRFDLPPLYAVC